MKGKAAGKKPIARKPARKPAPRPVSPKRAAKRADEDQLARRFDGREALDKALKQSGALGDVDDVVQAFRTAVEQGVPPQPVILALWEDEPRFASPADAEQLFANLLGLYELVASKDPFDLGARHARVERIKKEKTPPPVALGDAVPDTEWLEAAWRYLEDTSKERERLGHAFDNRQDALVSVIDAAGVSDAGFAVCRELAFEVFALLELGGLRLGSVDEADVPAEASSTLPDALVRWVEDGVIEAEAADEQPLPVDEQPVVQALAIRLVSALWSSRPT
jgi:hypothetical protein